MRIKQKILVGLSHAVLGVVLMLLAPMGAVAEGITPFSAEMIQRIPNQEPIPGRLYVSESGIRMETGAGDTHKITIINFTEKKTVHLNPARKEYMLIPWPAQKTESQPPVNARQPLPGDPNHPCAHSKKLKCNMLSKDEKFGDRTTEKWEIVRIVQVEKQKPRTMRSVVWVDRQLGANVREERFIDGVLKGASEFVSIKEQAQPKSLFQVPADYQRLEIPPPPSSGNGAGGGR